MPCYPYSCTSCSYYFETYQGMNDEALTKCPECKKKKLERVLTCPLVFVKANHSDVKTVGQLADRNDKKAGKSKMEDIRAEREQSYGRGVIASKEERDRVALYKKLRKLPEDKKHKYIMEGELPPT